MIDVLLTLLLIEMAGLVMMVMLTEPTDQTIPVVFIILGSIATLMAQLLAEILWI